MFFLLVDVRRFLALALGMALAGCLSPSQEQPFENCKTDSAAVPLLTSKLVEVFDGIPVDIAEDPGGAGMLVALLDGRIVRTGGAQLVLDLRTDLDYQGGGEQGLLAIETAKVDGKHRLFVLAADQRGNLTLDSFGFRQEDGTPASVVADLTTRLTFLERKQFDLLHFGGDLLWHDSMLFVSLGEGNFHQYASGKERSMVLVEPSLFGKLLAIDPDTGGAKLLATGLRNPWRFDLDPACGRMFLTDVGGSDWEEINVYQIGEPTVVDYGWDYREGPSPRLGFQQIEGFVDPDLAIPHDVVCAIMGGDYRARDSDFLPGYYIFADLCTHSVYGWNGVDKKLNKPLFVHGGDIYAVRGTELGETWLLGRNPLDTSMGSIYALVEHRGGT